MARRKYIIPKDPKTLRALTQLSHNHTTITDTETAKALSRQKKIKELRELDKIFFGCDRRKKKSIIHTSLTLNQEGNKFYF